MTLSQKSKSEPLRVLKEEAMKYQVTLLVSKFMKVGEDYMTVDVPKVLEFKDWDDVQNVVGYMVGGSEGSVKFEIKKIEEA